MVKEIHVAVIGAGYWGTKLISEYLALSQELDYVKLSAIVDVSKEKLEQTAKKFNLPHTMLYTSLDAILGNSSINAVHVATPNETHFEVASIMLEYGKHVLLEKPMALSSRDAFKLVRLAELLGKILLVGHIFRFNDALLKVRKLIRSGEFGEVRYVDLSWAAYLNPPPSDRDVIFDLAPHPVDVINFLLDEWPREVYTVAHSPIRKTPGLEEYAYTVLRLPKNIVASIKLSWLEHGPKKRWVHITTDKATIFVDTLSQLIALYYDDKRKIIPLKPSNTIRDMLRHFINAILKNEAPNNSALIGALTVVVLEGMRKSIGRKKAISLLI